MIKIVILHISVIDYFIGNHSYFKILNIIEIIKLKSHIKWNLTESKTKKPIRSYTSTV